jgi:hypothetical protein
MQTQQQKLAEEQRELERESGQQPPEQHPAARAEKPPVGVGTWLGRVAVLGLASPFIELTGNPFWGVMGLLILFFGIRIAWRLTAGRSIEIDGPFADSPPTSP